MQAGGLTDVGLKRDHNEDSILISRELGLFIVADGMGGHAAGEVASKAAISLIREHIQKMMEDGSFARDQTAQEGLNVGENVLYSAISNANRELCSLAEQNPAYCGMGTTIAAVYMPRDEQIHISHVGDSRVYRYREGILEILTQDHSWVNEQIQKNVLSEEEARTHRWRNVITRALGNRSDVEIDLRTVDSKPGDLLLLCSDGLTTMLDDMTIADILKENSDDLYKACAELIRVANDAGGNDNISVVLIRVGGNDDKDDEETQDETQPEDEGAEDTQPPPELEDDSAPTITPDPSES